MRHHLKAAALVGVGAAALAVGGGVLRAAPGAAPPTLPQDTVTGYPIENEVVVRSCAGCHAVDSAGRMSRISYMRKTPEGWQESIRRMVSLNGVRLEPAAAREVVRYLADRQGIAPEELRPARWEVERRSDDFDYDGPDDVENTCIQCHSMGRVMTQRRTREEWQLLMATHRGYYPLVDFQAFYERSPGSEREGPHPVEKAVAHFAEAFPLQTAAWSAWSANVRPPRLEGTWALRGHDRVRGPFYGTVEVRPAEDGFTSEAGYIYPEDGGTVTRSGRAVIYTGYQWRGRSHTAPDGEGELREVMMVERGWSEMSGRWFTGAYDELGVDVTLLRAGAAAVVTGVHPAALAAGSRDAEVRVFGHGLGAGSASDLDLGPGVRVTRVVESAPQLVVARVDVAADAPKGVRDLVLGDAVLQAALVVHDGVDRIEVLPPAGMARVGGEAFPKQYERFEAVGWDDGPDGKSDTDDDLRLGRVPVTWALEEYPVTYDDDDTDFVGAIDQEGVFTPAVDGPNPERSGERNNIGDVWVIATHTPEGATEGAAGDEGAAEGDAVEGDASERPLRARAHLLVTVPLYMRWDPWPPFTDARSSAASPSPNPGDDR